MLKLQLFQCVKQTFILVKNKCLYKFPIKLSCNLKGVVLIHPNRYSMYSGLCACKKCRSCTFSTPFFLDAASLGCQTLVRFGACRVLPRRGQIVPVLRQVRACGTSKGLVFQQGFLPNAANHGCDGFTSLCSHPLLPNHR